MKKLYPLFIVFLVFVSCNNDSNKNNNDKKTPTYHQVNVKNVNGNIPDTTNAIDLSRMKPDTATLKDTSIHR